MTLQQIREKVTRLTNGSVMTDETPLDPLYVDSVINNARSYVLRQDFMKTKRWSPLAVQSYYPDFEEYYQNSVCYTRFTLPCGFIQGNASTDGLVYAGSSTSDIYSVNNFWTIKSRNKLSDLLNNETMSPATGRYIGILLEGLVMTVISKHSMVKHPMVSGVFTDPQSLPTYNIEKDEYPIPEDLIQQLYDVIQNGTIKMIWARQPDVTSDSKQTTYNAK